MRSALVRQFARFAVVGGLGVLTNLAIFFALVDVGGLSPFIGAVAAFAVAVTQNYVLNQLWTFRERGGGRLAAARYAQFVATSLLGLAVNLAILGLLVHSHDFALMVIPQCAGILGGTFVNFAASRWITFR
jgi:dolichol-phosphate mannosyltransferase